MKILIEITKKILKPLLRKFKKILQIILGKNLFYKIFYTNVPVLSSKDFIKWWKRYKESNKLDLDLQLMLDDLLINQNFKNYSPYWNYLAQNHIKILNDNGIENFKQTIERFHYWGEGTVGSKLLEPIWNDNILIKYNATELLKKHEFCSEKESKEYNRANLILLNYLVKKKYHRYLDKLEEQQFGNPIIFNYQNKRYSFSLLNTIFEISLVEKYIDLNQYNSILEIGAGSGRVCSALMQMNNNLNYTIVDIPPTLFIAQSNLSNSFKNKRIFKYRNFKNFDEIEQEFISCDIRFLSPEQLELIPNKFFDLSIAVDCLHEFNKIQVDKYFYEFNRLSKFFYFKCQNIQWATFEKKEKYSINNYPVKSNWNKIIHEKCYIPNRYFHALYEIS